MVDWIGLPLQAPKENFIMNQVISEHTAKKIEKSLLIVDPEHPINTLPFISDALTCMGTFFQLEPELDKTSKAETGAGIILQLLALAIDDVQDAFEKQYKELERDKNTS